MRIVVRGFAAMVRDAVRSLSSGRARRGPVGTAPHHEVRMGCDATPSALILRSARRARLEGWPRLGITALALALALVLTAGGTARAQTDDYPSRTVTFICPFPAGGGTDILVRL